MPQEMLTVDARVYVPRAELRFTYVRSSGPGGQNVNKVASKAVMRWRVARNASLSEAVKQRFQEKFRSRIAASGDLVISSQRYRDQGRNMADCLDKLRAMLAVAAVPPKRRKRKGPTRGMIEKRLQRKREQSEKKQRRQSLDS